MFLFLEQKTAIVQIVGMLYIGRNVVRIAVVILRLRLVSMKVSL